MGDLPPLLLALGWLISTAGAVMAGVGFWQWKIRREDRQHGDRKQERADHQKCLEKVAALERRLEVVEHHHSSLFARWIKDARGRICWVNGRAMATIFGPLELTRDEVEGRTFQDLLDVTAAAEIDRLERAALALPGMAVSTVVQLHPRLPVMIVVAAAGVGRDMELIYEGHAYPDQRSETVSELVAERRGEQMGLSVLRLMAPDDPPAGD